MTYTDYLIKEYLKHDRPLSHILRDIRNIYDIAMREYDAQSLLIQNKIKLRSPEINNKILKYHRTSSLYKVAMGERCDFYRRQNV